MKRFLYDNLTSEQKSALLKRPLVDVNALLPKIASIFSDVGSRGDSALRELTLRFDRVELGALQASSDELARAESAITSANKAAIDLAIRNITRFHEALLPSSVEVETMAGVICRREWRAIERVGLYVPGGRAPLVSTVLMLAIPAKIAGCSEIILCTPPGKDGAILPEILYAASKIGVQKIFKLGGAQAIAAMSLGTESVPPVDKLFGPGNPYVAAAKLYAAQTVGTVGMDMLAGPSELLVLADESADPRWIAADLISQAEHGPDSHVVLVTPSDRLITEVSEELQKQAESLGTDDLREALSHATAIQVKHLDQGIDFTNSYAPEHLSLALKETAAILPKIRNAGSVFVGASCSVVFGDYASGTNHTLPTSGTARFAGGLTTESFMKPVLFQTVSPQGLKALCGPVASIARIEGLEAHARAAEFREGGMK